MYMAIKKHFFPAVLIALVSMLPAPALAKGQHKGQHQRSEYIAKDDYASQLSMHMLYDQFPRSNTIAIENGTEFTVRPADSATMESWPVGSLLHIALNNHWYSTGKSYQYVIKELHSGTSVKANLSAPPTKNDCNRRIMQMSSITGQLLLNDGHRFQISPDINDRELFTGWQPDDIIIIANNNSWFTGGYDFVLINTTKTEESNMKRDNYVTACLLPCCN